MSTIRTEKKKKKKRQESRKIQSRNPSARDHEFIESEFAMNRRMISMAFLIGPLEYEQMLEFYRIIWNAVSDEKAVGTKDVLVADDEFLYARIMT